MNKIFHFPFLFFLLFPLFSEVSPSIPKTHKNNHLVDQLQYFPKGPGRNLVINTCSSCHSLMLVRQNAMSRDNWDKTITWMQKTQNLWELDKKDRHLILDYLSENFGQLKRDGMDSLGPRTTNPLPY